MIAVAVLALFLLPKYAQLDVGNLSVNLPSAIIAGLVTIMSLVFYIWAPKKVVPISAMVINLLTLADITILVANTGNTSSPFITLWIIAVFFSGLFGIWGIIPIIGLVGYYIGQKYLSGQLSGLEIAKIVLSSLIPLLAGITIWHSKSGDDSEAKEYKNLASELNEVANKSEVVINAIGDGVIAIDGQGVVQLINPAAQTIIGWGKQDALALNYKSVLNFINEKNEPLAASTNPIQQAMNLNQQIRTDVNLLTASGKNLVISLVVSPVGQMGSGVIVVFHDATKERAEEREQAEFISTASHEMRTPVASIEGYLGLAMNPQTASIDNRARDYILKAHGSAQHLGRLFQDLLDVSKADDGRISNNPKVIDIVKFTEEIAQGLEQKATDKGLKIVFKPIIGGIREKHLTPVFYVNQDNDHIREILNNLIENAIKYTPRGQVEIDVEGNEHNVIVSIRDTGIGIPAEDMPHLFQKFYRVDDKDTREIGGTGLGLYLSRRLAEIMGGRVWVESVYGNGSTFYLELPRIDNQEASILIEQESFKAQQEASSAALAGATGSIAPNIPTATMASALVASPVPPQVVQAPTAPVYQAPIPPQAPAAPPVQAQPPVAATALATAARPATKVPRSQSLTPEQIAAYVAKQRALAQQQAAASRQSIRVQ